MHIVIALMFGCALLYFWLQGHWFARILAFLVAAPIAFLIVWGGFNEIANASGNFAILAVAVVASGLVAYLLTALPTWFWRARMRSINEAEMRWPRPVG